MPALRGGRRRFEISQAETVGDDGDAREAHGGAGEDGGEEEAGEGVEGTGGEGDADDVVDEGPEEILFDDAEGGARELEGVGDGRMLRLTLLTADRSEAHELDQSPRAQGLQRRWMGLHRTQ